MAANWENSAVTTGLEKISFHSNPKEKECKKAKWWSEEALQTAEERREAKAREKGKDIPN